MAFLCPSRLGKAKQKKGLHNSPLGRISGSGSIDTLLNIDLAKKGGLGPVQRMIILHNFTSYTSEELTVKQGQKVYFLYREYDWAYVVTDDKKEGFVPFTYLAKIVVPSNGQHSPLKTKSNPSTPEGKSRNNQRDSVISESWSRNVPLMDQWSGGSLSSSPRSDSSQPLTSPGSLIEEHSVKQHRYEKKRNNRNTPPKKEEITAKEKATSPSNRWGSNIPAETPMKTSPFRRIPQGDYLVLYDFTGSEENEISVWAAERVSLLNSEDNSWYWVATTDRGEGFVPRNFLFPISLLLRNTDGYSSQRSSLYIDTNAAPDFKNSCLPNGNATPSHLTGLFPHHSALIQNTSSHSMRTRPISFHQGLLKSSVSTSFPVNNKHGNPVPSVAVKKRTDPTRSVIHERPVSIHTDIITIKQEAPSGGGDDIRLLDITNGNFRMTNGDNHFNGVKRPTQECDNQNSSAEDSNHINQSNTFQANANSTNDSDSCKNNFTDCQMSHNSITSVDKHSSDHVNTKPSLEDDQTKSSVDYVAIFDYNAQGSVDLSLSRGDLVQVALDEQDNEDWYWAYSPRLDSTGYIPRSYVKVAQITVI